MAEVWQTNTHKSLPMNLMQILHLANFPERSLRDRTLGFLANVDCSVSEYIRTCERNVILSHPSHFLI